MNKEQNNPWKIATIVLTIVLLIIVLREVSIYFDEKKIETIEIKTPEQLCSEITGFPSWAINGTIIDVGYKQGTTPKVVDMLIQNKIYFLYSSQCKYCHKQIEDFGEDWQRYQNAGLTFDCYKK